MNNPDGSYRQPRREPDVLDPITRQARGDGAWRIVTRHGQTIGIVERETSITPYGKRRRVRLRGSRFHAMSMSTAIFLASMHFLGISTVDQQEYLEFIRGARLTPEPEHQPEPKPTPTDNHIIA